MPSETPTNPEDPSFVDQDPGSAPNDAQRANDNDPTTALARERDSYREQLQRTAAEFANYQKRARAQADSDRAYAVGSLATDLLDVIDNFDRALDAARAAGDSSLVDGLSLVHRQLLETLAKHGVQPIVAVGQPFDPNRHEAILQRGDTEHPQGTVVAELARGYMLGDRVLRPTKVAVSA